MLNLLWCFVLASRSLLNTQRDLALENLAIRHRSIMLQAVTFDAQRLPVTRVDSVARPPESVRGVCLCFDLIRVEHDPIRIGRMNENWHGFAKPRQPARKWRGNYE
jgi:hypothetical protein